MTVRKTFDSGALVSEEILPDPTAVEISFDDFEKLFTTQEWDDATDYSFAAAPSAKRKIKQGLDRAIANNKVDLLDAKTEAFLGLLVTGGVITATRKTAILTP